MNQYIQVALLGALVASVTAIPPDMTKENFITMTLNNILGCLKSENTKIKSCVETYGKGDFDAKEFKPCLATGACAAKNFNVYTEKCEIQWDEVSKLIEKMPTKYAEEAKKLEAICKDKVKGGDCQETSKQGLKCILDNSEKAKELINKLLEKLSSMKN